MGNKRNETDKLHMEAGERQDAVFVAKGPPPVAGEVVRPDCMMPLYLPDNCRVTPATFARRISGAHGRVRHPLRD